MDEPSPEIDPGMIRRCAVCGELASYGFGPPGGPVQQADAWYYGTHRQEGDRHWTQRHGHPTDRRIKEYVSMSCVRRA